MAYNTFNPPVRPRTTTPKETPNVVTNDFGDQYAQDVRDGIHPTNIEATLSWDYLTQSQCSAILTFLRANAGGITEYEKICKLSVFCGKISP